MYTLIKNITIISLVLLLNACGTGIFDKDNTPEPTPLKKFTAEITPRLLWGTKTGNGIGDEYLKFSPAISDTALFTAATNGVVTSIDKTTGHINWQAGTAIPITASPGIGDNLIVLGNRRGDVIALRQANGSPVWKTTVPGEILATPAIGNGVVVIKAIDGYLRGLSVQDGHELWSFQQVEPSLILRGASAPLIYQHSLVAGFANGNLAKLTVHNGQLQWLQTIAIPQGGFAIQRMIDIDADPVLCEQHLYAATYQGKIAALDWTSGRIRWSQDISSYTGMAAEDDTVYISDAKSYLYAFSARHGELRWRQTQLAARIISSPAILGNYIIVGDAEGYLHWLNKTDGHFAAREKIGSAIYAPPIVAGNIVYILTNKGYVAAYSK